MEELISKLKEAVEATAAIKKQEAIVWQELAKALDGFTARERERQRPVSEFSNTAPSIVPNHMTTRQAAEHLGIAHQTLNIWRTRGGGPPFIKIGRLVRYKAKDLENFSNQGRYPHTSAYNSKDKGKPR